MSNKAFGGVSRPNIQAVWRRGRARGNGRVQNEGMPALPILVALLLLAGCASIVPEELEGTVNRSVTGAGLIRDPEGYRGQTVVVGGAILLVHNRAGESEIEVLERPLEREEPLITDRSAGRFLIRSTEFLDPVVYEVGRRVTVVGTVAGVVERRIDDVTYRYPVVESRRLELWPLATGVSRAYPYPPWWYDPFWGPYGGPFWYRDPLIDPFLRQRLRR